MNNVEALKQVTFASTQADTALRDATQAYTTAVSLSITNPTTTIDLLMDAFNSIYQSNQACKEYTKLVNMAIKGGLSAAIIKTCILNATKAADTVISQSQELAAISRGLCAQKKLN